jgi:hypothetical protein
MNTENAFALVRDLALTEEEVRAVVARYSRPRRQRIVLRFAVVAGAAAALAVGALTALPGDPGQRLVEPASAAQRAAAALAAAPGSVVHVDLAVDQRNPDGSRTSWRAESWQQTAPPYELRQIATGADGEPVETATVGGKQQLYDRATNTVRIGAVGAVPEGATPQPATAEPFRTQVTELLRTGKLTRSGRATVAGRELVSFVWNDGQTRYEYTVEARSYIPVRWRFSTSGGTETTVTFDTYEILPADETPLDLTHHHPDASVQQGP